MCQIDKFSTTNHIYRLRPLSPLHYVRFHTLVFIRINSFHTRSHEPNKCENSLASHFEKFAIAHFIICRSPTASLVSTLRHKCHYVPFMAYATKFLFLTEKKQKGSILNVATLHSKCEET